MKKLFGKALAMAVMMSVFAGSAYAANGVFLLDHKDLNEETTNHPGIYVTTNERRVYILENEIIFTANSHEAIRLNVASGLNLFSKDISGAKDITASGTITAGTSGAIKSGETALVNGGAVYTALEGKVDAADVYTKSDVDTKLAAKANAADVYTKAQTDSAISTAVAGKADTTYVDTGLAKKANAADVYTKSDVDTKLDAKANAADVYSKSETDAAIAASAYDDTAIKADIAKKADQTDLDTETQERKDADDNLQKQINAISGGSSAGLNELNNKINQTDARLDRVGATAAALAAINYQPMAKGQSQVAIGMGGYNGKKATAIGLAYQFDNRISGSVAGAANGSEHMFNVGFNYLFGQHSAKDIAAMAATPGSMSLTEAELRAENKAQNNQIQAMQAEIAELKAMVKALAAK